MKIIQETYIIILFRINSLLRVGIYFVHNIIIGYLIIQLLNNSSKYIIATNSVRLDRFKIIPNYPAPV